jgi:uncharacterized protein (TIGR03437 family)
MRVPIYLALFLSFWRPGLAIPVSFEKRDPTHFLARFESHTAEVWPDRVVLGPVTLRFSGANSRAKLQELGTPAPSTYVRRGFSSTLQQFSRVAVQGLYSGVDVMFYGNEGNLEYDLAVGAGADPERIRMSVEGTRAIRIDRDGNLLIDTGGETLQQKRPRVFQSGRNIAAHYILYRHNLVGIGLGTFDHRAPLTIDPVWAYSTTFGGSKQDIVRAMALDPQGNVYVGGMSNSADFPTTPTAFQPSLAPPLVMLSNAGRTMRPLRVGTAVQVGLVGGTNDGRILYASTTDGIFLSGDSGATWRRTAPLPVPSTISAGSIAANAIAVDEADPATVLVATSTGLFGSTDGGHSWYPRGAGLTVSLSGNVATSWVAYDPNNPLIAYAITSNPSYLFRSTDAGNTWFQLDPTYPGEPPAPTDPFPPMAANLTADGKTLFVADGNGTLLKSSDGGSSWTKLAERVFFDPVSIALDPTNPNTIYVLDLVHLWKSTDGGMTFSSLVSNGAARTFSLDSSGALYIADFHQIRVSTDGGATFSTVTAPAYSINLLSSLAGNVYAGETVPGVPFVVKLDPTGSKILYSTFAGGSSGDFVTGLAVDNQGSAILVGTTISADFPLTVSGASAPTLGKASAFILKLSSDGTRLVYSTVLGGSKSAGIQAVAADASGAAFVTGATSSTDFPTTDTAFQRTIPTPCTRTQSGFFIFPNTSSYGFVTKISADGRSLLYSTYLTGACGSSGQGITLDPSGAAFVTGYTTSPDFPVSMGSYQAAFPGKADQPSPPNTLAAGFVSRLSPAGDKLLASTYLGGGFSTQGNALVLDPAGNPTVTGFTQGFALGATPGAYQTTLVDRCTPTINIGPGPPYTGTGDAFVLRLDPALSSARFLTYLGGACNDSGLGIALDAGGNIWVSGSSSSPDFPLVDPFQAGGIPGGFLSELSPDASKLLFSSLSDSVVVGLGASGVYQAGSSNGAAFVAKIDPLTTPVVHIDSIVPVTGYPPASIGPFVPGIAPGQLIEVKGRNLGPSVKVNAALDGLGRLPFVLSGATVFFDNIPAPLISVQGNSIECFAPFEINSATQISVSLNGQRSNSVRVGVPASLPQILTIMNSDGTVNSSGSPAKLGSTIALYVSGLGETNPLSVDGLVNSAPLPVPVVPVNVFVPGGQVSPSYVGAAPGLIAGITQVNVPLPQSIQGVTGGKASINVNGVNAPLYVTP